MSDSSEDSSESFFLFLFLFADFLDELFRPLFLEADDLTLERGVAVVESEPLG
jgi:hypothetical protein